MAEEQIPEEPIPINELRKEEPFWKRRAKHGRDTLFASPQALWEAACEYFEFVDNNPMYKAEWKDNNVQSLPVKRPYTMMALCVFLGCNTKYFANFKQSPACTDDFNDVICDIENIVYTQKFEGAASGFFNANLISRDLGLADKKEIENNVNLKELPVEFK